MSIQNFSDDVTLELNEMKKLGMHVPERAFSLAKDLKLMEDYSNMGTTGCSDLLVSLSSIM